MCRILRINTFFPSGRFEFAKEGRCPVIDISVFEFIPLEFMV